MDYSPIEAFLVGRCGLTEKQAALTSMNEYKLRVEGDEKAQVQRWEVARWQMWYRTMLSPDIKSINKPKHPTDLFLLPNEQKPKATFTAEDCHISADMTAILEMWHSNYITRHSS